MDNLYYFTTANATPIADTTIKYQPFAATETEAPKTIYIILIVLSVLGIIGLIFIILAIIYSLFSYKRVIKTQFFLFISNIFQIIYLKSIE